MPNIKNIDLIGISGLKRSGKGTAATWFIDNMGFVTVKFADPLKDMLRSFFTSWGIPHDVIERLIESDLKEVPLPTTDAHSLYPEIFNKIFLDGKTSRYLMQTLGTEWRELISTDMWVDMADNRICNNRRAGKKTVVDDMRFMHEVNRMTLLGALKIKVRNNRISSSDGHASEQDLPDSEFDVIIDNNGTIAEFHHEIRVQMEDRGFFRS